MSKSNLPLYNIKVAAPCSADWNGMLGNDRVRFCGQCNLNVYNLSDMSKRDAENLIQSTEGRLCVRFYQRNDGTVLTDNCPVGLRAIKRRAKRIAGATISAVLSFAAGIGLHVATSERFHSGVQGGVQGEMVRRELIMGDIAMPAEPRVNEVKGQVVVGTPEPTMGKMVITAPKGRRTRR